jgi:hypothetical protein
MKSVRKVRMGIERMTMTMMTGTTKRKRLGLLRMKERT